MNLLLVVPCFNEEEMLPRTISALSALLSRMIASSRVETAGILLVDDGSSDHSWQIIAHAAKGNPTIMGLKLAHNVGHQRALWAGLHKAASICDAAISIDADLQDDIEVIPQMVDLFHQGVDVVYGVRRERATDSFFKRTSAQAFYSLMRAMHTDTIYNHADFRLMSRRALQALMAFPERNLYLRGMVCALGFPSAKVYYNRKERAAGTSKYPLGKMLSFAIDGVTSFSVRPLKWITLSGFVFMGIALLAIFYSLVAYLWGKTITGWTSLIVSLWFIGGAILISCGIIGEYVGKIYQEVKRRPRFLVEKEILPAPNPAPEPQKPTSEPQNPSPEAQKPASEPDGLLK